MQTLQCLREELIVTLMQVIARTLLQVAVAVAEVAATEEVLEGTQAEVVVAAVKNATNVGKSATLLGTAPKVAAAVTEVGAEVEVEVDTVGATTKAAVATEPVMEEVAEVRPATLAVDMDTCLVS